MILLPTFLLIFVLTRRMGVCYRLYADLFGYVTDHVVVNCVIFSLFSANRTFFTSTTHRCFIRFLHKYSPCSHSGLKRYAVACSVCGSAPAAHPIDTRVTILQSDGHVITELRLFGRSNFRSHNFYLSNKRHTK